MITHDEEVGEVRVEAANALATLSRPMADAAMERLIGGSDAGSAQDFLARQKCHRDLLYHLDFLSGAVESGAPELFAEYVDWAAEMLESRGIRRQELAGGLEALLEASHQLLDPTWLAQVEPLLADGIAALRRPVPTSQAAAHRLSPLAARYLERLLDAERADATRLILDSMDEGVPVREIYLDVFEPVQHEIGRLWQLNRISIAQEHYCTAATQLLMGLLYEHIFSTRRIGRKMISTCVPGSLHEVGIRMVSDFFELDGWDTYYLGANIPASEVVRSTIQNGADLVAISVTLTYQLGAARELIAALRAEKECADVRILVGGPPFRISEALWRNIGADGAGRTAAHAVEVGTLLVNQSRTES